MRFLTIATFDYGQEPDTPILGEGKVRHRSKALQEELFGERFGSS